VSWIGTRRGAVRVVSCVEGREGEEEKAIYLDFSFFNESFSLDDVVHSFFLRFLSFSLSRFCRFLVLYDLLLFL